jgi:phosphatidylserine decarboxylase
VMSGFIGEAQSSRNVITKLIHKVSRGEYSIGANSANIIVINREVTNIYSSPHQELMFIHQYFVIDIYAKSTPQTGQIMEEKIPTYIRIGIRMLYRSIVSPVESRRMKRTFENLTLKQGNKYTDPKSAAQIPGFIKYHQLNVNEILHPLDSFKNFNEFFYRELKPGARTLAAKDPVPQ